jgi:hypothetical protein
MLDTTEALRLMLGALALGVALPVMIQLFLLLRQARKTIARVDHQIEPALRLFHDLAQRPRDLTPEHSHVASIVATIIPAVIAAFRAYRQHQAEETAESASLAEKEEENART